MSNTDRFQSCSRPGKHTRNDRHLINPKIRDKCMAENDRCVYQAKLGRRHCISTSLWQACCVKDSPKLSITPKKINWTADNSWKIFYCMYYRNAKRWMVFHSGSSSDKFSCKTIIDTTACRKQFHITKEKRDPTCFVTCLLWRKVSFGNCRTATETISMTKWQNEFLPRSFKYKNCLDMH